MLMWPSSIDFFFCRNFLHSRPVSNNPSISSKSSLTRLHRFHFPSTLFPSTGAHGSSAKKKSSRIYGMLWDMFIERIAEENLWENFSCLILLSLTQLAAAFISLLPAAVCFVVNAESLWKLQHRNLLKWNEKYTHSFTQSQWFFIRR